MNIAAAHILSRPMPFTLIANANFSLPNALNLTSLSTPNSYHWLANELDSGSKLPRKIICPTGHCCRPFVMASQQGQCSLYLSTRITLVCFKPETCKWLVYPKLDINWYTSYTKETKSSLQLIHHTQTVFSEQVASYQKMITLLSMARKEVSQLVS